MNYIWHEDQILEDLKNYIDSTYSQHYAGGQTIQTTEYIASNMDLTEAIGAFRFNVLKYAARYGKKDGYNRKDLLKAMHYLIMLLGIQERLSKEGD